MTKSDPFFDLEWVWQGPGPHAVGDLWRRPVPGGWLYLLKIEGGEPAVTFVPNPAVTKAG